MNLRKLKRKKGPAKPTSPKTSPEHLRAQAIKFTERNQFKKASECYRKLHTITPGDAAICNDLGITYHKLGDLSKAASWYKKAITRDPNLSQAYYNLGNVLYLSGMTIEALSSFKKAIAIAPDNGDALNNIGNILYDHGRVAEAVVFFNKAVSLDPQNSSLRSIIVSAQNYISNSTPAHQLRYAKEWWQIHGKPVYRKTLHSNTPAPRKRLKIGYISPDFREHSISYFFVPLLENHDHRQVEVICYSDAVHPDSTTDKIKSLSDHWQSTSKLSDYQVARLVEQDKIDILIDLAGHMTGNRLLVFARQPAPLQISWLGYPNTTGLPTIQYRLTDEISDPTGTSDKYYTEKLIRMPSSFLCYAPPNDAPEVAPPPDNKKTITFASFNNPAKMTNEVVRVWAKILHKLPESKLQLKGKLLRDDAARQNFVAVFTEQGAKPSQIEFLSFTKTTREHLSLYGMVDICLDPFPYNGTTTTCEALWMGVPVITIRGNRHASRVTATILERLGLTELIANSETEYVDLAVQLAESREKLQNWRTHLRQKMLGSPLCDAPQFSRDMEKIYRQLWQEWCHKENRR